MGYKYDALCLLGVDRGGWLFYFSINNYWFLVLFFGLVRIFLMSLMSHVICLNSNFLNNNISLYFGL